ncbi:ABC transporter ATP-binding protein/permease [Methylococcus sp. EFPC2]|uniref:ABC transporter ATP-binding protein/permease n=1 Tax=Methylococcus sp. EFPC2 TaxID=2812648 RepID=UPI001966FFEF|nr:ABC transporter transmembrane domain-containing protein [Methylococcus sp. EFPC2]QSA98296.1 ABC transporter ATP-binding protein/permease [Methylococcus sp. EFPC2]
MKTKPNREQLLNAAKSFVASEVGGKALYLSAALLFLLLAVNGLNVVNSFVGRDFITALAERNADEFTVQAILYLVVFALSTLVAVIFRYTEQKLGMLWRDWLTRRLVGAFLADRTYYRLKQDGGIENPDQRIADDIRSFTVTTLSFVLMILNGSITIITFSGVMWTISPQLFAVTLAYGALGSYLTLKLGRPLIGMEYSQLDKEADFRGTLHHVWQNTESIALAQREENIETRLSQRMHSLIANYQRIILMHRNLGFFTTGYNYLIQILPTLIVAPLFLRGEVEFGVITQSAMAFAHLVGAFSLIVNQFQSLSSFAAIIARLGALGEVIRESRSGRSEGIVISRDEKNWSYDKLSLLPPKGDRPLLSELSLSVPAKSRVLIAGPNEDAKQALFKASAGLWEHGSGHIILPGAEQIHFLPERPYFPPGTLREFIAGVSGNHPADGEPCDAILKKLGLMPVVNSLGGLDREHDWTSVLSLDEQQLFSFARILHARPSYVFLNRVSGTLSAGRFHDMLELLSEHSIGYLNIGKADEPEDDYDAVLELKADGLWNWRDR